MPPPPRPIKIRNNQSLRHQVSGLQAEPPTSTNRPSQVHFNPADVEDMDENKRKNLYVLKQGIPCLSDEELVTMSAKSDAAMAEIIRMCEPFLDPCADIQEPPPMELSTELIDDLGVGFLFPTHAGGPTRARRNIEAKRSPTRAMQPRNVAHMAPSKQGTKRKEYPEDNENFQHVQLDAERQECRPVKRVKSVHNANPQRSDTQVNKDAAKNSHQQPPSDSQLRKYLSGYGYGRTLGRSAPLSSQAPRHTLVEDVDTYNGGVSYKEQTGGLMGMNPDQVSDPYQPQHYSSTLSRTTFPSRQPPREPVASPYIPISTVRQGFLDHHSSVVDPGVSAVTSPHSDVQSGQAVEPHPYTRSSAPNAQDVHQQQQAMAQPSPNANRGHHREPRAHISNLRYYPYTKSRRGIAQSIEASQMQQLSGESSVQPVRIAAARVDKSSNPDVAPTSLEEEAPSSPVPNSQWDQEWDSFLEDF